jgi:excisionase family DNA binding protein
MRLLSFKQVAERLGVSEVTLRKIRSELPTVRVGRRIKYTEDAVVEFIQRGGCRQAEFTVR